MMESEIREMLNGDVRFLRNGSQPIDESQRSVIRVVDLFAGCGGLSLGFREAAFRAGVRLEIPLAVDIDKDAGSVFRENFPGARFVRADLRGLLDGELRNPPTFRERLIRSDIGKVDVLLGGPPCQGHSNLNNHTRRTDPKNELYILMARGAEVLEPSFIVIENVPAVLRDRGLVVERAASALVEQGYEVAEQILDLSSVGVPQTRKRHLLLASKEDGMQPEDVLRSLSNRVLTSRTVRWAIEDLRETKTSLVLDQATNVSETNKQRIRYLRDHDLFDLPNSERPECHRGGGHSYKSMYGRLRWDRPSQTVTTGFGSIGQGRFIHPDAERPITPHEAARLQTFPDSFEWGESISRTKLAMLIGNAVPPLLALAIGELVIPHMTTATPFESPAASSPASRNRMRANKRRDTKPELALRRALFKRGLRYRVDVPPLESSSRRADIVFTGPRVAVFVDGCFWHSCPIHATKPTANAGYWKDKLQTNERRDEQTNMELKDAGWVVVRVWEHEDPEEAADLIQLAVTSPDEFSAERGTELAYGFP